MSPSRRPGLERRSRGPPRRLEDLLGSTGANGAILTAVLRRAVIRTWVALSFAAFAALGCDAREAAPAARAGAGSPPSPARLERTGESGLYRVAIAPEGGAIPLRTMHAWVVEVATVAGEPFSPTRLAFDGGMPQHGHGLPSAPRVTRSVGAGQFLVEGVKFHMGGDWTLRVEVVGPSGADVAVFHVQVDG